MYEDKVKAAVWKGVPCASSLPRIDRTKVSEETVWYSASLRSKLGIIPL